MNGTDIVTQMLDMCLKTPDPNATVAEFTARLGALRAPRPTTLQRGGIISGKVSNAKAELMMAVEVACKEAVAAGHEGAWMVGPISKGMKTLEVAVRKETLDQVLALIRNQD